MSGPSASVENAETANANEQTQIGQTEQANSAAALAKQNQLEAPAINLYTALTTGDPAAQLTATAPIIGQISSGYQAAKDSIFNTIAPGAGRDYALSQLNVQSDAQKASTLSNATTGAFTNLANIGAGYGSESLSQIGASLSGLSGSTTSLGQVGSQQAASKAATMGFLGSLVSGAGDAVSGGFAQGGAFGCWIAEALYGVNDIRTHIVRQWLNHEFSKSKIGHTVMRFYSRFGQRIAAVAHRRRVARLFLRPLFDLALSAALKGH